MEEVSEAISAVATFLAEENRRLCCESRTQEELFLDNPKGDFDSTVRDLARKILRGAEVYDAHGCPLCLS